MLLQHFFHVRKDGTIRELTLEDYQRLGLKNHINKNKKTFVVVAKNEIGISNGRGSVWIKKKALNEILGITRDYLPFLIEKPM